MTQNSKPQNVNKKTASVKERKAQACVNMARHYRSSVYNYIEKHALLIFLYF